MQTRDEPVLQPQRAMVGMQTALGFLATLFVLAAAGVLVYTLFFTVGVIKEVLVAVIGAGATLLATALTVVLTRLKEVELAGFQRLKEIELAGLQRAKELETLERQKVLELEAEERKTRQENYERIVNGLAAYVRMPKEKRDEFETAYILTWIVGSNAVVERMDQFLKVPNSVTLDVVLRAMRADLKLAPRTGQPAVGDAEPAFPNASTEGLFREQPPPPVPATEFLKSGKP